jgi:hypothetical protein
VAADNSTGNRIRWFARRIGSLVAAYWLFIGILSAIGEREPWTLESTMIAGFIIALVLAVTIAWWREGIGGTIAAFSAFAYFTAGHNKFPEEDER